MISPFLDARLTFSQPIACSCQTSVPSCIVHIHLFRLQATASHSGSSIWQAVRNSFKKVLDALPCSYAVVECRKATRYKEITNDMTCTMKPAAMKVRFDADCNGLSEDHCDWRV